MTENLRQADALIVDGQPIFLGDAIDVSGEAFTDVIDIGEAQDWLAGPNHFEVHLGPNASSSELGIDEMCHEVAKIWDARSDDVKERAPQNQRDDLYIFWSIDGGCEKIF